MVRVQKSVLTVLLLAAGLTAAQAQSEMAELSDVLEPVREEFGLPALFAAVAKGGDIVAAGAVGERAAGSGVAVTVDDRVHIGSDAKAMTATIAGTLVESGDLRWESTIGEVLGDKVPGLNPELADVTLDQLLSHSSGIPTDTPELLDIYFNANAFDHSVRELRLMALDAWKDNAPVIPDVSPFQYANFGYMIAGMMMEEVTGKAWEQLIRERIFQPLGLDSAGIGAPATPGLIDAAVGHDLDDDGTAVPRLWGAWADLPPILGPAGRVHMSILDFARWGAWNAAKGGSGPQIVAPATLDHLYTEKVRTPPRPNPPPGTPAEGGYASGWSLEKFDWADRELLTHAGSNGSNLAKILIDHDLELAIVVATNIGGLDADTAVTRVMGELYQQFR